MNYHVASAITPQTLPSHAVGEKKDDTGCDCVTAFGFGRLCRFQVSMTACSDRCWLRAAAQVFFYLTPDGEHLVVELQLLAEDGGELQSSQVCSPDPLDNCAGQT